MISRTFVELLLLYFLLPAVIFCNPVLEEHEIEMYLKLRQEEKKHKTFWNSENNAAEENIYRELKFRVVG
jgi:hypothetical protein